MRVMVTFYKSSLSFTSHTGGTSISASQSKKIVPQCLKWIWWYKWMNFKCVSLQYSHIFPYTYETSTCKTTRSVRTGACCCFFFLESIHFPSLVVVKELVHRGSFWTLWLNSGLHVITVHVWRWGRVLFTGYL